MKKALLVCAIFAVMIGVSSGANAQFCFSWAPSGFCDGLELSKSGPNISGTWQNWDCGGSDVTIRGRFGGNFQNNCSGGNSNVIVACRAADGCSVAGQSWWFNIESPIDGTMDMNNGEYPSGSCWIDELAYSLSLGACPFAPVGGRPLVPLTGTS